MKTSEFKHTCSADNAPRFAYWMRDRGGVAVWFSADLGTAGQSVSTPATIRRGDCDGPEAGKGLPDDIVPYPSPGWKFPEPSATYTDPAQIGVCHDKEVRRFRVAVRRGYGLRFDCTPASTAKIRRKVEQAGDGAHYVFDYDTQEAVILKPDKVQSLAEWIAGSVPCGFCANGMSYSQAGTRCNVCHGFGRMAPDVLDTLQTPMGKAAK